MPLDHVSDLQVELCKRSRENVRSCVPKTSIFIKCASECLNDLLCHPKRYRLQLLQRRWMKCRDFEMLGSGALEYLCI